MRRQASVVIYLGDAYMDHQASEVIYLSDVYIRHQASVVIYPNDAYSLIKPHICSGRRRLAMLANQHVKLSY